MKQFLFICLFFSTIFAHSQEKILNYSTTLEVQKDRSIIVTEKIKVWAFGEGGSIQRGIFRDIPYAAVDKNNLPKLVEFELLKVLRDGIEENYTLNVGNDLANLRMGREEVFLKQGEHTYEITYKITDQLRLFDEYDEIYWNAIGTYWGYEILAGDIEIILPKNAKIKQINGYTGVEGTRGKNFSVERGENSVLFTLTAPLIPYSGFTVAVGFEKGAIFPPTEEEIQARYTKLWLPSYILFGALIILVIYYIWAWFKVGIDPEKGTIIAQFDPPKGYSPAAVRFVMNMGFDKKAFTAALINIAVKGGLIIKKEKKTYILEKKSDDLNSLSSGEKKLMGILFSKRSILEVKNTHHSIFAAAIESLKSTLKGGFEKENFRLNSNYIFPGGLITIAAIVIVSFLIPMEQLTGQFIAQSLFTPVLGSISTVIFYKSKKVGKVGRYFLMFLAIVLVIPIFFFPIMVFNTNFMSFKPDQFFWSYFLPVILLYYTNVLFLYLIKAPTVQGRKIMDQIEGLKMFMEIAEKDRLDMLNPPDETPALFEKLLPYAVALDVENKWSRRFEAIISKALENNEYRNEWYYGHGMYNLSTFSSDLGSGFNNSLSSSSVNPSSGSSGSGSVGGGGGGGGGGGW